MYTQYSIIKSAPSDWLILVVLSDSSILSALVLLDGFHYWLVSKAWLTFWEEWVTGLLFSERAILQQTVEESSPWCCVSAVTVDSDMIPLCPSLYMIHSLSLLAWAFTGATRTSLPRFSSFLTTLVTLIVLQSRLFVDVSSFCHHFLSSSTNQCYRDLLQQTCKDSWISILVVIGTSRVCFASGAMSHVCGHTIFATKWKNRWGRCT
jgi:hypothetical protein